mgnify:CR=1 FL=1
MIQLCTLVLNEIEWLDSLYKQHRDWPELASWVFVESADRVYAETNPEMVTGAGLSVDGTSEYLQSIANQDSRVTYIPYGFSGHVNPDQGKCESRNQYLNIAEQVKPEFLFILDADEFYTYDDQYDIIVTMRGLPRSTGFTFRHRHPWCPPSMAGQSPFTFEVTGGFWDIPHTRGWRWEPGLRYNKNHNTPENFNGVGLDKNIATLYQSKNTPECIHMAFASSLKTRHAKHKYYAARGEGKTDHRGWYVESRTAFETWEIGDILPRGAQVVKYSGEIPECFQ